MRFLPLIMAIRSWLVNVKAAKAAAVHMFPMTQAEIELLKMSLNLFLLMQFRT